MATPEQYIRAYGDGRARGAAPRRAPVHQGRAIVTGHLPAAPVEARSTTLDLSRWAEAMMGGPTKAGERVSSESAFKVSVVLACVGVLARGVAQTPLRLMRDLGAGRSEEARGSYLYDLLARRPNEWMTSYDWRCTMMMHAALWGDAYSLKLVSPVTGKVTELLPLDPRNVAVEQAADYRVQYRVSLAGRTLIFPRERMLHLRGLSWNGLSGMRTLELAREAIGLAMAAESTQGYLHGNGGRPSGILSTDQPIKPETVRAVREAWLAAHGGTHRMGTAVLDGGFKFQPLTMSGVDAQHLETRRFQVEDICRFFNVFPQMVMATDKAPTYASAEAFFGAHVRHTLGPWFEQWTQLLDADLLDGRGPLFVRFDTREMTKASLKDRAEALNKLVQTGIYTRNEARAEEGLPPLPGLDEPLTPVNTTTDPAGMAADPAAEDDSDAQDQQDR